MTPEESAAFAQMRAQLDEMHQRFLESLQMIDTIERRVHSTRMAMGDVMMAVAVVLPHINMASSEFDNARSALKNAALQLKAASHDTIAR